MSETKFTPGPWYWDGPVWDYDRDEDAPWLVSGNDKFDAVMTGELHCNRADANLIAAAPELFEALLILHPKSGVWCTPTDEESKIIEATLAKLRGEK